ncbi:uncharacterized protein KY384_002989 [Bacidia gigantensis]|uniref:uncharacterized protein n=1 Tax=Bacidia gigantensis TaxID=2732470 RepID=UPI001D04A608|nr:uncharacterized protein KY384_002989 [Bacidia gigantensis]KAG8531360.1 hypothetical protein KY384_002989 [Bacidia gigantensis]
MDRIRNALKQRGRSPAYEPLDNGSDDAYERQAARKHQFSYLEYCIFVLLGIFMLWACLIRNMFLAASPYFQHRFSHSPPLLKAYSPTLLSISTVTNLLSVLVLSYIQAHAHYPHRIILSLVLNGFAFTLLAISTVLFRSVSEQVYFTFLMLMVALSAIGTGICQNGLFAYVSAFNEKKYTQGIMAGQGIAGVLSCLAQIISVLSIPPPETATLTSSPDKPTKPVPQESGKSALAYFLTATFISLLALLAFTILTRRHPTVGISPSPPTLNTDLLSKPSPIDPPPTLTPETDITDDNDDDDKTPPLRKSIPLLRLYRKLHWLANAVFLTFTLTLFYPVFTQQIHSKHPPPLPRLLQPSCFIPLAFLFWNIGDLVGRLLPLSSAIAGLTRRPRLVFSLSVARVLWIPLYMLCNRGLDKRSGGGGDFFYLVIVQAGFGVSNGLVGSLCMMGSAGYVEEEEKEAAGGFMGLMLVGGLSVGSLLSFLVA